MSETQNEKIVRQFFETLSGGDYDKLHTMLHPEGTWTVMAQDIPGAGTHKGRKGVIDEFLAPVRGMFNPGEPKIKINRLFSKDDFVCAETEAMGTLNNGKKYHNRYCWSIEVKDGMVSMLREYMDTAYVTTLVD